MHHQTLKLGSGTVATHFVHRDALCWVAYDQKMQDFRGISVTFGALWGGPPILPSSKGAGIEDAVLICFGVNFGASWGPLWKPKVTPKGSQEPPSWPGRCSEGGSLKQSQNSFICDPSVVAILKYLPSKTQDLRCPAGTPFCTNFGAIWGGPLGVHFGPIWDPFSGPISVLIIGPPRALSGAHLGVILNQFWTKIWEFNTQQCVNQSKKNSNIAYCQGKFVSNCM